MTMEDYLIFGGFFTAVMGLVFGAGYYFLSRHEGEEAAGGASALLGADPPKPDLLADAFRRVGEAVPSPKRADRIAQKLNHAGYRLPQAPQVFNGIKAATGLMFSAFGLTASLFSGSEASVTFLPAFLLGCFGFMLPDRVLEHRVKARSRRLRDALPPALDLIVLGLEAGQGLDGAIAEAAREIRESYPDLSAELNMIQMELLAGKTRVEAFRNLGERSPEPEVKRLAQLLVDCDRFGTSLAGALRTHVKYVRTRMRQQAREAARKVGVKLVFPVFFLIFPSVLLVTLGPAVLQIVFELGPMAK